MLYVDGQLLYIDWYEDTGRWFEMGYQLEFLVATQPEDRQVELITQIRQERLRIVEVFQLIRSYGRRHQNPYVPGNVLKALALPGSLQGQVVPEEWYNFLVRFLKHGGTSMWEAHSVLIGAIIAYTSRMRPEEPWFQIKNDMLQIQAARGNKKFTYIELFMFVMPRLLAVRDAELVEQGVIDGMHAQPTAVSAVSNVPCRPENCSDYGSQRRRDERRTGRSGERRYSSGRDRGYNSDRDREYRSGRSDSESRKDKEIVVVTVGTVVVEVVVDIVAVAVAVRIVISHTAVHTETRDSTVEVVVLIRRVDQGGIKMTVDPSANTDLMRKEQTMNAGPVGMERTVVQRRREPDIAMESGHPTMSVGVTAITARPQQIPRVLVLQLSVFAVRVGGIWRLNVRHRAGTRVRMSERVVFRMRVPVPSVKPHPRQYYLRILSPSNLYLRVWADSHTLGVPCQTSMFGGCSYLPSSIRRTRELRSGHWILRQCPLLLDAPLDHPINIIRVRVNFYFMFKFPSRINYFCLRLKY